MTSPPQLMAKELLIPGYHDPCVSCSKIKTASSQMGRHNPALVPDALEQAKPLFPDSEPIHRAQPLPRASCSSMRAMVAPEHCHCVTVLRGSNFLFLFF